MSPIAEGQVGYFRFRSTVHGTASRANGAFLWSSTQPLSGSELLISTPRSTFYHASVEQWVLGIPDHHTAFAPALITEASGRVLSSNHRTAICDAAVDHALIDRTGQPVFTVSGHAGLGLFFHARYRASAWNRFGPMAVDDQPVWLA